jgi:hypothetical protein
MQVVARLAPSSSFFYLWQLYFARHPGMIVIFRSYGKSNGLGEPNLKTSLVSYPATFTSCAPRMVSAHHFPENDGI